MKARTENEFRLLLLGVRSSGSFRTMAEEDCDSRFHELTQQYTCTKNYSFPGAIQPSRSFRNMKENDLIYLTRGMLLAATSPQGSEN